MQSISVPAKIMIIGEYGVIEGGLALLAAVKPPFVFSPAQTKLAFAEFSPVSCYAKAFPDFHSIELKNTGLGAGFGTSSAELIAGATLREGEFPETEKLWRWFKSAYPEVSGADLAVQLEAVHAKHPLFEVKGYNITKVTSSPLLQKILVYRSMPADKLKTHEDLARKRKPVSLAISDVLVSRVRMAFETSEASGLDAFNEFADYLAELGLETKRANKIRKSFRELPQVRSVKGCGAGLNDVFLVVASDDPDSNRLISSTAEALGLEGLGALGDLLW